MTTYPTILDSRELATVLAALRLYQAEIDSGWPVKPEIEAIATDQYTSSSLDVDELDDLCERLNCE